LPTRIVIPLRLSLDLGFTGKPSDLLPVFEIDGKEHFLDTPAMSAVSLNALGRRIRSLAGRRDVILAALDRIRRLLTEGNMSRSVSHPKTSPVGTSAGLFTLGVARWS
jgi:hypothetical protein